MTIHDFAGELRCIVLGFVAALVPSPQNERLGKVWNVDVAPYSMAIGLVEAAVGGLGFLFGGIAAMTGDVETLNMFLLHNWFPGMTTTHFQGAGLIALFFWVTHPMAWFLALLGMTGIVRIFTFVATRGAVGEPVVWLVMRIVAALGRSRGRASRKRELGPMRGDRLIYGKEADLVIFACRERQEWNDAMTLAINDRYFRLLDLEDRLEGAYHVLVYRFTELGEHEVIRRPVGYVETQEALQE